MQNRKKKRSESEYKKKRICDFKVIAINSVSKVLSNSICLFRSFLYSSLSACDQPRELYSISFVSIIVRKTRQKNVTQTSFFFSGVSIHHYFLFKAPSSNVLKSRIRNLETHNQHNTQQSDASAKDNVNALIYMYAKTGKLNRELSENPII